MIAGRRPGPTGILFDFDGVIALSEHVHMRSWEDLAAESGETLPEGFLELGVGFVDTILSKQLSEAWGGRVSPERVLTEKRRHYNLRCPGEVKLVPGVLKAIERLAEEYPLGLGTSSCKSDIDPIVEEFGLRKYFKTILTVETVKHPKPDPEIYLNAARLMERDPLDCWVFEDSVHGTTAARATGGKLIALTTTHHHEKLKPYHMAIDDYTDLDAILDAIRGNGA